MPISTTASTWPDWSPFAVNLLWRLRRVRRVGCQECHVEDRSWTGIVNVYLEPNGRPFDAVQAAVREECDVRRPDRHKCCVLQLWAIFRQADLLVAFSKPVSVEHALIRYLTHASV